MLETRTPPVSTLPRPAVRGAGRTVRERVILTPPPAPRPAPPAPRRPVSPRRGTAAARVGRLARSEAHLLTVAIVGTALMCAVLVLYLAAYAHVSRLGVDSARARAELRQARLDNDQLQARLASLQNPTRLAAAARNHGMTAGGRPATYITLQSPQGDGARNEQVAIGGTAADHAATDGH